MKFVFLNDYVFLLMCATSADAIFIYQTLSIACKTQHVVIKFVIMLFNRQCGCVFFYCYYLNIVELGRTEWTKINTQQNLITTTYTQSRRSLQNLEGSSISIP